MGKYQNVKGTLDYFQEDAESFVIFNEKFNHMCFTHMFEPINVPILESTELFQRTSGDSSDIVRKQMYTFKDKSDRNICLRPEFTASVIRAVIQAKKFESQIFPMRYFYSGDVFRYERAKPGTYREFHQIGVGAVRGRAVPRCRHYRRYRLQCHCAQHAGGGTIGPAPNLYLSYSERPRTGKPNRRRPPSSAESGYCRKSSQHRK